MGLLIEEEELDILKNPFLKHIKQANMTSRGNSIHLQEDITSEE